MNSLMMAFCGIDCENCPIHLATIETDARKREEIRQHVVDECFRVYGMKIKPEDINECDGCKAPDERLFLGCKSCEIRKCAQHKKLKSCAFCKNYPCLVLQKHFKTDPLAQQRLDELQND